MLFDNKINYDATLIIKDTLAVISEVILENKCSCKVSAVECRLICWMDLMQY